MWKSTILLFIRYPAKGGYLSGLKVMPIPALADWEAFIIASTVLMDRSIASDIMI